MRSFHPPCLRAAAARFARAERGATAVEFSLISIPFLMLIFGVIELAMVFMVTTTLETATEHASRQIRTGSFQTSTANTKADFKALVCSGMTWLSDSCATNLHVDVRTLGSFGSLATTPPQAGSTFDPATTCWSPGQPSDIVLVRTYYQWRLFTPLLDRALENMGGGSGMRLLSTATAFRNEPYSDDPPGGAAC